MNKHDIGLIGLAVMGQNLARNIASKGFSISVYNRTQQVTDDFVAEHGSKELSGTTSIKEFVDSIAGPRKILLLVKAGDPVDAVIESLLPYLDEGDLIVDCGNSLYKDTIRRTETLADKGILFSGSGVSGGEEGALNGPSIMPGGTPEVWEMLKPVFENIAAKDFAGGPCVTHVGTDGAGHFVKMVHNGIEYAFMQAIAEVYFLLKELYGMQPDSIAQVFSDYNEGPLESYLIEISAEVLAQKDDQGEGFLIDKILDKAGQKGTGAWTAIDSLERGITLTTIAEAVFARTLSAQKDFRTKMDGALSRPDYDPMLQEEFIKQAEDALLATMYVNYAQGYDLIMTAAAEQGWEINLAEVSRIWQGGCIIRARMLETLTQAFKGSNSTHLLEIDSLKEQISSRMESLRNVSITAISAGVPAPVITSAVTYLDGVTRSTLSANMIQGLRDYFGAHTYERTDMDGSFHTDWLSD